MATESGKESLAERCLKLAAAVDWRGFTIVLAALAGIGGAIWNKVDAMVEKALAARTQQGVYELLAEKLDDVSARLATLEASHTIEVKGKPGKEVPGSKSGKATPKHAPDVAMATVIAVDAHATTPMAVEPTFKAARLPSFQTIQQHAQTDELPSLMRRDIAAAPSAE